MFASNQSATEKLVQNIMPATGTVASFYFFIDTAPGAGSSWTFFVRKNGIDTTITCTISGASQTCSDLTHTASFAAGDLISVREASSGTPSNTSGQWTATFQQ